MSDLDTVTPEEEEAPKDRRTFPEVISESRAGEAISESFSNAQESLSNAQEKFAESREELLERLGATLYEIKPKLRGWFHLFSVPIAVIGGLILMTFTPTLEARAAVAVFVFASILLFSISATYHRSNGWVGPKTKSFLQRTDHASITFLIAGTCTPLGYLLLDGEKRWILLLVMWVATLIAIITKYTLNHPSRWINVPIFVLLGWTPTVFLGELYKGAVDLDPVRGVWAFALIVTGGLLYSIGAVLFAWRPAWLELKKDTLGFHEIFHLFTVLAFLSHYGAISLIAYSVS